MARTPALCVYCGKPVGPVRKGEHVVPKSLGCVVTVRCVCSDCNNALSGVDKELVSQTPLAMIAAQELDASVDGFWDYNAEHDLALEARIVKELDAPVLWPQVVLDDRGPMFWFDLAEARQLGRERYRKEFIELLTRARNTLRGGCKRPRWLWMPVAHPPRRGRFPPRVFTPHGYREWSNRIHFKCRYAESADQGRILWSLDNWRPFEGKLKGKEHWGGMEPEAQMSYNCGDVLRALVKIGLNLLVYVCGPTQVNRQTFSEAIAFARYDEGGGPSIDDCGFVWNTDVAQMECPPDAHKFRLTCDQNWALDCAFFGGRMGATVAFPGPCAEQWSRVEIVAPLGSPDWTVETSPVILPRRMHVNWGDLPVIAPSLPAKNVEYRVRVERRTSGK